MTLGEKEKKPEPTKYWFGQREDRVFLYDRSFQPEEEDDVFLWEIGAKSIRHFKKPMIRQVISPVTPDFEIDSAVKDYEVWRESNGQKYRIEHTKRISRTIEAEFIAAAALSQRNREIADKSALAHRHWFRKQQEYQGVDMPQSKASLYRTSVCWSCASTVNSKQNPTCRRCGWLVCVCDACECNTSYAP